MNTSVNNEKKLAELLKEAEAELTKSIISTIEKNLGQEDQTNKTNLGRIETILKKYSENLDKLKRNKSPKKIFSWLINKVKSPFAFGRRIENLELENKEIINYLKTLKREIEILKSQVEKEN